MLTNYRISWPQLDERLHNARRLGFDDFGRNRNVATWGYILDTARLAQKDFASKSTSRLWKFEING